MNSFFRILICSAALIILFIYNIIRSFVLFFIPRRFRWKKDITGQNILITGAGSGVGRELAIEFSKYSVCLVLVDINRESLLKTEKLLHRCSTVFIYDCDVSNSKMVYQMGNKIKEEVGDVDILINNAGIVQGKYLTDLPDEKIRKTIDVNTLAHFWTCKAFLPAMMERNSGHIVSVVSVAGKMGAPRVTDYCASKFAAFGFAESLEVELQERKIDGVKVTIVCPYHISTGLFDGLKVSLSPPVTPEYVAQEIVYSVLTDKETVFVPEWTAIVILKEFIPRWMFIQLAKITGDINAMKTFTGRTPSEDGEILSKPEKAD